VNLNVYQIHPPEIVMHQAFGEGGSLVRIEVVVTIVDLRGERLLEVADGFAEAEPE